MCIRDSAYSALKSDFGNSTIVEVAPVPTPVFEPVNFVLPITLVLIPTKSVLKSIFNIFISWSLVNFSVGSNNKFLIPLVVISVFKSPNFSVVKSVDFSNKIASSSSVNTTISLNCVSNVSGSTTCIK